MANNLELPRGGLHLLGWLPNERSDSDISLSARAHGLGVVDLSSCRVRESQAGALLLGFASTPEEAQELQGRLLANILSSNATR